MARLACRLLAALLTAVALYPAAGHGEQADAAVERGAYLFRAAGCAGCHSDAAGKDAVPAGGRALATPFGTFYGPNITPDPVHGLGRWSQADFRRALRQGRGPEGQPYYPAFPYGSFSALDDGDIDDLWHYLRTLPAVARPNRAHALKFPFNLRLLLFPWRWLFFDPAPFQPEPGRDGTWNRGAYLAQAAGHCAECHSPRGPLGQIDETRPMAGNAAGPEGKPVPNVTPHPSDGIGKWSLSDIEFYLQLGMTPEGDFAGGAMTEVIRNSTQHLTPADRRAVAVYLKGLAPLGKDGAHPAEPAEGQATRAASATNF